MSFAVLESDAADVYAFLIDLGCCRRCSLRFLGEKEFFANFENADQKVRTRILNNSIDISNFVDGRRQSGL